MTGLELLKAPEATAGEIADIISAPCPPTIPAHCDGVSCRECWLTWLTGEPIKEKEPPDKRTAPDEEGLHPNLVAFLRQRKHLLGVLEDVKDDVTVTADFVCLVFMKHYSNRFGIALYSFSNGYCPSLSDMTIIAEKKPAIIRKIPTAIATPEPVQRILPARNNVSHSSCDLTLRIVFAPRRSHR